MDVNSICFSLVFVFSSSGNFFYSISSLSSTEKFHFAPFLSRRVREIFSIIKIVNVILRYCKYLTVTLLTFTSLHMYVWVAILEKLEME